jgi:glycosyltransferase involved in cell wall biosynthesis
MIIGWLVRPINDALMRTATVEQMKTKSSVVIISYARGFGGVNRAVSNLWKGLTEKGLEVFLYICSDGERDFHELKRDWFDDQSSRINNKSPDLEKKSFVRRVLSEFRFLSQTDSVNLNLHVNSIEGLPIATIVAAKLLGKHVVLSFHHLDEECVRSKLRSVLLRTVVSACHRITVSTPLMEQRVRRLAPTANIHCIPYGLPCPVGDYSKTRCRSELLVPEDAFVVGHLSRQIWDKGLPRVIAAVERLRNKIPNIYLLAAGADDIDGARLRELFRKIPSSHGKFLGPMTDSNLLYGACDVFAVPSGWEGFGLVYIEASFHGIPRIGTRRGGVIHAIRDGEDGFLIPYDDIDMLANRLELLYIDKDLRIRLGKNAKQEAVSNHTIPMMASKMLELYR